MRIRYVKMLGSSRGRMYQYQYHRSISTSIVDELFFIDTYKYLWMPRKTRRHIRTRTHGLVFQEIVTICALNCRTKEYVNRLQSNLAIHQILEFEKFRRACTRLYLNFCVKNCMMIIVSSHWSKGRRPSQREGTSGSNTPQTAGWISYSASRRFTRPLSLAE